MTAIFSSARLAGCAAALALFAAPACADAAQQSAPEPEAETASNAAPADAAPADAAPGADVIASAPDGAWRTVSPTRLMRIETTKGAVLIETAPEFAPTHVARFRELAEEDFFDFKVWHRVIDDFMAQGGGALDNPNANADKPALEGEFTIRRDASMTITELQDRTINPRENRSTARAGFWNGFQAATQPIAQAAIRADGQVESWLLHCEGAVAAARTQDPNSARSQFYITRAETPHLETTYTVWGKVRDGQEAVNALEEGALAQDRNFSPDFIEDVVLVGTLPAEDQPTVEVMDTSSDAFAAYLDAVAQAGGGTLPNVCDIDVPVRIQEPTQ